MYSFIGFIAFIILVISVVRLSSRVKELERKVGIPQPAPRTPTVPVVSVSPDAAPVSASQQAPYFAPTPATAPAGPLEPTAGELFAAWLKEDWLLKLGAFMLLLGFAWLTTYAFMNNWIGPMGRIALGIIAGAAFMGFGFHRMGKFVRQGGVFLVLGSATVILTIFAARTYYDFFTPFTALAIMFLAAAFVALASVRYRVQSMALISLILAGLTPVMIGGGSLSDVSIFTYLLLMTLGTVWVVALTGWRALVFAALVITSMYSIPYWIDSSLYASSPMMMFAYAFAALFFIVGTLGVLKSQGKERKADLLVAAGNGLFLLFWVLTGVPAEWQSLVLAAWMVVFAGGGFVVFRVTRHPAPFLLYAAVATMFLAAATAIELDGAALTIAFTFEAAVIPFLLYYLVRNVALAERTGLLLIVPAAFSLPHIIGSAGWFNNNSFGEDFAVLLCMAIALLFVGLFFRHHRDESPTPLTLHNGFIVAGLVYIYIIIWNTLHQMISVDDMATMMSLIVYTVIGLATHFYGKLHDARMVKLHGSVLLGFVVSRLLLVDVWQMEMGGRIITFFIVGALLMTTAFVGRKKKTITTTV